MFANTLYTHVSTNYLLRTNDEPPAFVAVSTTSWRKGPWEVLKRLFDHERTNGDGSNEHSFRPSVKLETGDERYSDLLNERHVG